MATPGRPPPADVAVARPACSSSTITRCCGPGVANIINQELDLEVVAEAADGRDGVEAFRTHRPDVTLMDLRMPEMEGVEAVRRIREIDPQARVIVLTTYDADEDIARALQAGAKAYILKDIAADALVACIRDVLAGKTYLAPTAAAKLAERVTQVQLTPRELARCACWRTARATRKSPRRSGFPSAR